LEVLGERGEGGESGECVVTVQQFACEIGAEEGAQAGGEVAEAGGEVVEGVDVD
jgi:hypothetical protein